MIVDFLRGLVFGIGFLSVITLFGIVYAVGFHTPSEILPGSFSMGNFSFNGNLNLNSTNPKLIIVDDGTSGQSDFIFMDSSGNYDGQIQILNGEGSMNFRVNNTEMMRMLPNGKIGIGTNNPNYKLEVNGSFGANSSITAYAHNFNEDDRYIKLKPYYDTISGFADLQCIEFNGNFPSSQWANICVKHNSYSSHTLYFCYNDGSSGTCTQIVP